MIAGLIPFWIEFDYPADREAPAGTRIGVTAMDKRDALRLVAHRVFNDAPLPALKDVRENVDIATLDAGHVRPSIASLHVRGVWFPPGY